MLSKIHMRFLSRFKKRREKKIKDRLGEIIARISLMNATKFETTSANVWPHAGAELLYFLLHALDRTAFSELGTERRNEVVDEVVPSSIDVYINGIVSEDTPPQVKARVALQMFSVFNARNEIYSKCHSLTTRDGPVIGTSIFAYSFFVHRALGKTELDDASVCNILAGKEKISEYATDNFPDFLKTGIENSVMIIESLKFLNLKDKLKGLKQ